MILIFPVISLFAFRFDLTLRLINSRFGLSALLQKEQKSPLCFESRCKVKQVYNINQIILQIFVLITRFFLCFFIFLCFFGRIG